MALSPLTSREAVPDERSFHAALCWRFATVKITLCCSSIPSRPNIDFRLRLWISRDGASGECWNDFAHDTASGSASDFLGQQLDVTLTFCADAFVMSSVRGLPVSLLQPLPRFPTIVTMSARCRSLPTSQAGLVADEGPQRLSAPGPPAKIDSDRQDAPRMRHFLRRTIYLGHHGEHLSDVRTSNGTLTLTHHAARLQSPI